MRLLLAGLGLFVLGGIVAASCAAQIARGDSPVVQPYEVDLGNGNHVVCVVAANPYHLTNGGGISCNWKKDSP